jgi:hypothetical protein
VCTVALPQRDQRQFCLPGGADGSRDASATPRLLAVAAPAPASGRDAAALRAAASTARHPPPGDVTRQQDPLPLRDGSAQQARDAERATAGDRSPDTATPARQATHSSGGAWHRWQGCRFSPGSSHTWSHVLSEGTKSAPIREISIKRLREGPSEAQAMAPDGGRPTVAELEVGFGVATLKVSLNDFVAVVGRLTGGVQEEAVRASLKDMIGEVRKSYETAVDVFTPFFAIDSPEKFQADFANRYAEFNNKYLRDKSYVKTSSHIVANKISEVLQRQRFREGLPLLGRSYDRLQRLGAEWIGSDEQLGQSMDTLLKGLDVSLKRITERKHYDPDDAFADLQESLDLIKDNFLAVKEMLNALTVISSKL